MPCSAAEGQCPYGEDAPHFSDKAAAAKQYEKMLTSETEPLSSHRKNTEPTPGTVGVLSYKQHPKAPVRSYHLNVHSVRGGLVNGTMVDGSGYRSFKQNLVQGWQENGQIQDFDNVVSGRKVREKKEPEPEPVLPDVTIPLSDRFAELEAKFEDKDYDSLLEYANASEENYNDLSALIAIRARQSPELYDKINDCNTKNPDAQNPISVKNFTILKREFNAYRDHTAFLLEGKLNSKFYNSKTIPLDAKEPLGNAVPATQYPQSDPRWYSQRFDSIGGSDVGALVMKDFVPEDELESFDKLYIKKVEKSKVVPLTQEDLAKRVNVEDPARKGPLYRGTVWEDYIRDGFAEDHPEMTVYDTKGQYYGNGDPRQRVNFDGILSDREDKIPNGILEIKTGGVPEKWEDGIPTAYRAQTLYYLHSTGYDYAVVRAVINDGDVRDYHLHRDDEVYPGSGVTMSEYVRNNVEPWFEELKAQREVA